MDEPDITHARLVKPRCREAAEIDDAGRHLLLREEGVRCRIALETA